MILWGTFCPNLTIDFACTYSKSYLSAKTRKIRITLLRSSRAVHFTILKTLVKKKSGGFKAANRCFVRKWKKRGPNTGFWGAPIVKCSIMDHLFLALLLIVVLAIEDVTHLYTAPCMPKDSISVRNGRRFTEPKLCWIQGCISYPANDCF